MSKMMTRGDVVRRRRLIRKLDAAMLQAWLLRQQRRRFRFMRALSVQRLGVAVVVTMNKSMSKRLRAYVREARP